MGERVEGVWSGARPCEHPRVRVVEGHSPVERAERMEPHVVRDRDEPARLSALAVIVLTAVVCGVVGERYTTWLPPVQADENGHARPLRGWPSTCVTAPS